MGRKRDLHPSQTFLTALPSGLYSFPPSLNSLKSFVKRLDVSVIRFAVRTNLHIQYVWMRPSRRNCVFLFCFLQKFLRSNCNLFSYPKKSFWSLFTCQKMDKEGEFSVCEKLALSSPSWCMQRCAPPSTAGQSAEFAFQIKRRSQGIFLGVGTTCLDPREKKYPQDLRVTKRM